MQGPINLKNYNLRAEFHGGKVKIYGNAWPLLSRNPDIASTADEFDWELYYRDHLNGFPKGYAAYRNGEINYWNVPEINPQDFDRDYTPTVIK